MEAVVYKSEDLTGARSPSGTGDTEDADAAAAASVRLGGGVGVGGSSEAAGPPLPPLREDPLLHPAGPQAPV